MLETLSQNIPTLAFWQNDFDHLVIVILNYQSLVDAGIVHLSAKSVANKVNKYGMMLTDGGVKSNTKKKILQIYANLVQILCLKLKNFVILKK